MEREISVQDLVLKFLEETNQPIFLTGKAGTGKTTFLHHVKTATKKNYAVVAPTAVAAINAGGSTIHSFFQMPMGPLVFASEQPLNLRLNREKMALLIRLDLLIIDEISMVRCDTLDYIDKMMRQIKGSAQAFGGIQVLMIGDLFQLPPVWEKDWPILSRYYDGPFFFNSKVLRQTKSVTFELTEIYRQTDKLFISLLNHIRNGDVNETILKPLNVHINPELNKAELQDHITLSTHILSVQNINQERLAALTTEPFVFKADISGDFPADAYPADAELVLKVGAQVMFIKNDSSGKKQYYNGRTATVTGLSSSSVTVVFLDDHTTLEVQRETWQNVKFAISVTESNVNETNVGAFVQYPLRLAWAITIHKSQGLTFEKVVIDVASAFAAGQTYVALSRCRTLEGIVLKSEIKPNNVKTDASIRAFMAGETQTPPTLIDLETAKEACYQNMVGDVFNFAVLDYAWKHFTNSLLPNMGAHVDTVKINEMSTIVSKELSRNGRRFVDKEILPNKAALTGGAGVSKERMKIAVDFFHPLLISLRNFTEELFQKIANLDHEAEFYTSYNYLQAILLSKQAMLESAVLQNSYFEVLLKGQDALIKYKPAAKNWHPKNEPKELEVSNPELYHQLLDWRKKTADSQGVPEYTLVSERVLREIAKKAPRNLSQISQIKNFGVARAKEHGEALTQIVRNFFGEGNSLF